MYEEGAEKIRIFDPKLERWLESFFDNKPKYDRVFEELQAKNRKHDRKMRKIDRFKKDLGID